MSRMAFSVEFLAFRNSLLPYLSSSTHLTYAAILSAAFTSAYSAPLEYYMHTCCELVDQIQVQGMSPGDEGCLIEESGDMIYLDGTIITPENVPAIGETIHAAYDYYDPNDTDAWYNWEGYMVCE